MKLIQMSYENYVVQYIYIYIYIFKKNHVYFIYVELN